MSLQVHTFLCEINSIGRVPAFQVGCYEFKSHISLHFYIGKRKLPSIKALVPEEILVILKFANTSMIVERGMRSGTQECYARCGRLQALLVVVLLFSLKQDVWAALRY